MGRRGKIAIIVVTVVLILLGIAIPVYFAFINKPVYHITGVEKTTFTVADFADKSELQFFDNGTFHVRIEHKIEGLSLTGIGTYTQDGKTYKLKFHKAYARDNHGDIVDYTNYCDRITCIRTGNRIKFTDHKFQIFYFG